MSIELLEARIKEIDEAMKQLLANFNALEGAKGECLLWLNNMKKTDIKS